MKNSTPRRQFPKMQLLNFLAKPLTEKKYLIKALINRKKVSHKGFNLCEAQAFLNEIFKSIFSNK